MAASPNRKPLKAKTRYNLMIIILFSLIPAIQCSNPHALYHITWKILSLTTGETINSTILQGPLSTSFPTIEFDVCKLMNPEDTCMGRGGVYVCPGNGRTSDLIRRCGGTEVGFCSQWGCETSGSTYWKPSSSWDLITVTQSPNWGIRETGKDEGKCRDGSWGRCNIQQLGFTNQGKKADWSGTKTWGLYLYRPAKDPFALFMIQREYSRLSSQPVGPNPVLPDQRPASVLKVPSLGNLNQTNNTLQGPLKPTPTPPGTGDRLLNLIKGAFQALNQSDPGKTKSCWLCLNPQPPYYEGIAIQGNYSNHTEAPPACLTGEHQLTLTQVTSSGTCIGNPPNASKLCNETVTIYPGSYYLVPPNGTYWACNTGLTPCVSAAVLNSTRDFCVLIQLWPRIYWHEDDYVLNFYENSPTRFKREPISLTLAVLLGVGGITAGIGTGATALVRTDQYMLLHQAMNQDLLALEKSVRALKDSLTSLSEVVLQNRRGLDLLFLKQGGLCAALKEQCCFYADQTGIVTETLDRLKHRLEERKRHLESQQGWFENLYNRSPWFTTLVSTLAGPLVLLLLILTLGPCILNRLVQFVKERLSVVQALVLTSQYQALRTEDPDML
ncbi:MLV-related proviral Env polyprotein-like [Nannospalax galili]|uniref:MLV-related proviral Env polyprotein-like n=1 Tax=Nannospalax galili TaxID=1026970 RepID=UPI000819A7A0|nr:MLV-related proviral Env polyprotein-like [Nannospalax galili]